jgi:anthraniloyl-CoA monooxygenase
VFETDAGRQDYPDADLIIASDGLNSRIRTKYADTFQPDIDLRECRFVWLGTHKLFDAFTFAFEETEHGWFQAHAYQFDGDHLHLHRRGAGGGLAQGRPRHDGEGRRHRLLREAVRQHLDGHKLMSNASHLRGSAQWIRFPRVVCQTWVHHNGRAPVVLMGDAAHTAHFSIGSGHQAGAGGRIELARCIGRGWRPAAGLATTRRCAASRC